MLIRSSGISLSLFFFPSYTIASDNWAFGAQNSIEDLNWVSELIIEEEENTLNIDGENKRDKSDLTTMFGFWDEIVRYIEEQLQRGGEANGGASECDRSFWSGQANK